MRTTRPILASAALVLVLSGCSSAQPESPSAPLEQGSPSTTTVVSVLRVALTPEELMDEMVSTSDAIVIAEVVAIPPPQSGSPAGYGKGDIIYHNVILEVQRALHGGGSRRVAVRVQGGQIGDHTQINSDEPDFSSGGVSLLFLGRYLGEPEAPLEGGVDEEDYYVIPWGRNGKLEFSGDDTVLFEGEEVTIAFIEEKIAELRGAYPASEEEAPDDIIITPGGRMYRANVHQQGVENPWPQIESVGAVLGTGADALRVDYRDYIETEAGETRNNIIHVGKEGGLYGSKLALYAVAVPAGIKLTDGGRGIGLPGATGAVLVIEILPEVAPGRYSFEIGLEIDGKDYGTLPCTIEVVEGD